MTGSGVPPAEPPEGLPSKTPGLDQRIYTYLLRHTSAPDPVLAELAEHTHSRLPDRAQMLVSPEQGALLTMLTRLARARLAVELGTFTGYSALCIATGLPRQGQLVCFDNTPEWVDIGRPYWERAGVSDRIEVRIGDAATRLAEWTSGRGLEPAIDFAFVDAYKPDYPRYLELLLERLAPHGLIAVDNTLYGGRLLTPSSRADGWDDNAFAIAAFNDAVAADPRLEVVQLAVGDGLTLVQRRG